jgi:hypothetical protein
MTGDAVPGSGHAPTWSADREAWRVVAFRPHLRRTLLTALIVGTILFAINQLDVVISGAATTATWVKAAVTYLVPFAVANVGVLVASRRPPGDDVAPPVGAPRRDPNRPEQSPRR